MKEVIHHRQDSSQRDFPLLPRLFLRRLELQPDEEPDLSPPSETAVRDESGGIGWPLLWLIISLPVIIVVYLL